MAVEKRRSQRGNHVKSIRPGLLVTVPVAAVLALVMHDGRLPVRRATAASVDCPLSQSEPAHTPVGPAGLLPEHRIVSFYGNPRSARMGILGQLPRDSLLRRLREQAAAYAAADTATPVIPALHLVTVVAQKSPGAQKLYRARMPVELVEQVASWVEPDSMLLFLDIQPGASDMLTEARNYLPFLARPGVHLALDPEFAMAVGEVPGTRIGSIDADDVNEVIDLLADLVETRSLPPKILIVHRFTERMLTGAERIRPDPRVQVVITMDGFGPPALKEDSYRCIVGQRPVQFTGFKLFYRQDVPLMGPARVLTLRPAPHVIIYQ